MEWMLLIAGYACIILGVRLYGQAQLAKNQAVEIRGMVRTLRDLSAPPSFERALTESQDDRSRLDFENKRLTTALSDIDHFDAVDIDSESCFLVIAEGCYEIPLIAVIWDKGVADSLCGDMNKRWHDSDGEDGRACWVEPGRVSRDAIVVWNNGIRDAPVRMPDIGDIINTNTDNEETAR